MSWLTRLFHKEEKAPPAAADIPKCEPEAIEIVADASAAPTAQAPVELAERLVAAAENGDLAAVKVVLTSGEALDAAVKGAALRAVRKPFGSETDDTVEIARLLLDSGADVDAIDEEWRVTPLLNAVKTQNVELVRLLVAAGANPALADRNGHSPLNQSHDSYYPPIPDWSAEFHTRCCAIGDALREARPKRIDEETVAEGLRHGAAGIVSEALAAGMDVNAICQHCSELPLLLHASRHGQPRTVAILLERGDDPNMIFEFETALGKAINLEAADREWDSPRYCEVVRLLIEAGADVNLICGGSKPLDRARSLGAFRIARLIEEAGGTI